MNDLKPLTAFQQAYKSNLSKMTIARDYAEKEREKMNDLKPVGEVMEFNASTEAGKSIKIPGFYEDKTDTPAGTKLYAIPDTHRVVSVELLEQAVFGLAAHAVTAKTQLRAIIDNNEETK